MKFTKNRKKIIIILVIIILLILLIAIFSSKKNSSEIKKDDGYYGPGKPVYLNEETEELFPEEIYAVVLKYKGKYDISYIYEELYDFKNLVENLSSLSDEEVQDYYENLDEIEFQNIEQFIEIYKESKVLDVNTNVFEKASIDVNSIVVYNDRTVAELSLYYTNNVVLKFRLTIFNEDMITYLFEAIN